jgi:hypothetical protein
MSLRPGTRVGPYEVIAPLGAGGMLMMPLIPNEQSATQIHLVLNVLSELRQRVH